MKTQFKLFGMLFVAILTFSSCQKEPMACADVPATGTVGQSVNFNASCSMDAHHYEWNFGDGGTSMEANPTHTYNTAGTYTVKLKTMSKNSKKMDETSKSITIN
jgi:PKD repeat protein